MQKSLENKYILIGVVVILFLFSVYIIAPRLGSELIPEVHQGEFYVELTLPIGTPVEKTDERANSTSLEVNSFLTGLSSSSTKSE